MVVGNRSAEDVRIDAGYQHISEAPAYNDPDGETVDATEDPQGAITAENVPSPPETQDERRPDVDGQTTWDDWRWSA